MCFKKRLVFCRCVMPVDSLERSQKRPFLRFLPLRRLLNLAITEVGSFCFRHQSFEKFLHIFSTNMVSSWEYRGVVYFCSTETHIKHDGMSSSPRPCCRKLHTDLASSTVAPKKSYCCHPLPKEQLEWHISTCQAAKQVEQKQAKLIQARL